MSSTAAGGGPVDRMAKLHARVPEGLEVGGRGYATPRLTELDDAGIKGRRAVPRHRRPLLSRWRQTQQCLCRTAEAELLPWG